MVQESKFTLRFSTGPNTVTADAIERTLASRELGPGVPGRSALAQPPSRARHPGWEIPLACMGSQVEQDHDKLTSG